MVMIKVKAKTTEGSVDFALSMTYNTEYIKEALNKSYLPRAAGSIPIKLMKAIPIRPVKINAIPKPRNAGGTSE